MRNYTFPCCDPPSMLHPHAKLLSLINGFPGYRYHPDRVEYEVGAGDRGWGRACPGYTNYRHNLIVMAASWTNHLGYLEWHPSLSSPRLFNPSSSFALSLQCISVLLLLSLRSRSSYCPSPHLSPGVVCALSLNLLYSVLPPFKSSFISISSNRK